VRAAAILFDLRARGGGIDPGRLSLFPDKSSVKSGRKFTSHEKAIPKTGQFCRVKWGISMYFRPLVGAFFMVRLGVKSDFLPVYHGYTV
jgi:hypothetical protein